MCIFANEGGPKSKSSRKETPLKIQKYKEIHVSGKNLEKKFSATTPNLQFQISLNWKENRVQYQNLKKETSLNALTDEDIKTIWLPLIVYDNTDQKEVTRLGVDWEWATRVTVTREGHFSRSSDEAVDEAELFEGAENRLTMNQTYTWEFQCQYELQRYPFDTQVRNLL